MKLAEDDDSYSYLLDNNESTFRDMFMSYYPALCHYADSFLMDKTIAEDVVEDVFLKLWLSPPFLFFIYSDNFIFFN